jgi:hypothetical protein
MPFETGVFFAAKRFGTGQQKRKLALIFDKSAYRYRKFLSDISGQDISAHNGTAKIAISRIRGWLDTCQGGKYSLPGGDYINKKYRRFSRNLPIASRNLNLKPDELTYPDACRAIEAWLRDNA